MKQNQNNFELKVIRYLLLFALSSTIFVRTELAARDIEYLGDGRYKCVSGNCEAFNARQNQINQTNERYERQRREYEQNGTRERTDSILRERENRLSN